jgi:hypothetical protein
LVNRPINAKRAIPLPIEVVIHPNTNRKVVLPYG